MELDNRIYEKLSKEEKEELESFRSEFVKTKNKINQLREDLAKSKYDMSFWYKEQKAMSSGVKKHCPINAKTISEKREYYSPANDQWDRDYLPSKAVLKYAMSCYYKELIKFGEAQHKKLKNKFKDLNVSFGKLSGLYDELIQKYNKKYTPMWTPCKVVPKESTKEKHWDVYDNWDEDYKERQPQFAWVDVNPNTAKNNSPYYFRLDSKFNHFLYLTRDDLATVIYYTDEQIKKLKAGSPEYRETIQKYNELLKKNGAE